MDRPRILVVDDDLDIRLLLKAILSEEGYNVTVTGNGLEAFQEALLEPFDLVILDLMMPVMNGADFAGRLTSTVAVRPTVLVISAAPEAERSGRALGASRILKKPFDLQALLDTVVDLVGTPQTR